MEANLPHDEPTFWSLFNESELEDRFRYELNKPLAWILFLFSVGGIAGSIFISSRFELGSYQTLALWSLSALMFLGIVGTLFVWRMFARRSGVLITDQALVWLDRTEVQYVPWSWLDAERFGNALEGARSTEGTLSLDWDGRGRALTLYTPYMRVDHPALVLSILLRIKNQEGGDSKS
jgi:hypothetical protein